MRAALFAALVATALGGCAASGAGLDRPAWQQFYPLQEQRSFSLDHGDVNVVVTPPPPYPDDREVSDEEFAATYADARIVVTFPGQPAYQVPRDESRASPYGISVGIGRMAAADPAPAVLIAGYSGGAHCCATLQIVTLGANGPFSTILPMKDGEPATGFPRDIDGDGVRDLLWSDDHLLYAFASYAASWPVPRIYNLRGSQPVDVSREPRFAPIYARHARETLAACRERDGERNGACAAFAYTLAIQDRAKEGIRTAVSLARPDGQVPYDCTVAWIDDQCPESQERTFAGFEDALRWIMRRDGYLP